MNNKTLRDAISKQCGFTPNKAKPTAAWIETPTACYLYGYKAQQVCNAGDWPTVEDQQRYWQDLDDPGGNIIPSRVQANHDRYDNERHPFA